MKKQTAILLLCSLTLMGTSVISCTTTPVSTVSNSDISFKVAEKYFVKNTFTNNDFEEKIITAQQEFDNIFGMAATMGQGGKPTEIDFSKEDVLAIIHPKTNDEVTIVPVSLKKKDGNIIYTYKVVKGQARSFSTVPNAVIIIQKQPHKNIVFNRIN